MPTVSWTDITADCSDSTTAAHQRVVAIMQSMDSRYWGLGERDQDATGAKSPLSHWTRTGILGERRQIAVFGAYYDRGAVIKRVYAVSYTRGVKGSFTGMRLEMLGICRDDASHDSEGEWALLFNTWFDELRKLAFDLAGTSPAPLAAFVPNSMDWRSMSAFHGHMIERLTVGIGGRIIRSVPASDGTYFDLEIDWP